MVRVGDVLAGSRVGVRPPRSRLAKYLLVRAKLLEKLFATTILNEGT